MAAGVPTRWGRDQADSGKEGRRATPGARQWWLFPGAAHVAAPAQPLPCLWFRPGPRLLAGWHACVHRQPGLDRLFTRLSARYTLGIGPGNAVFAGDSCRPDYLGPIQAGMTSFLIGPGQVHEVPGNCRLASVLTCRPRWKPTKASGALSHRCEVARRASCAAGLRTGPDRRV